MPQGFVQSLPHPQFAQARSIAAQIGEATFNKVEGSFEITLNPEELGRVRITLNPSDGRLAFFVTAERAETLELMRRHIDQLNEVFNDLGFADRSFEFSQGHDQSNQDEKSTDNGAPIVAAPSDVPAPQHATLALSGVDLRL